MEPPAEADDDEHKQMAVIHCRIAEETVEVKLRRELAENKSLAPPTETKDIGLPQSEEK